MTHINQSVFLLVHNLAGRNFFLDALGIFLASYLPYLLVFGFFVLVYYQDGARRKIYLFCEGALAIILARGLLAPMITLFYHEARPFSFYHFTPLIGESGWSFPSGHATFFFALAMIVWFANAKWGKWYFALAIFIGIARVYVGVHWPLDVVAGAIIGIAGAAFVHWLLRDTRRKL